MTQRIFLRRLVVASVVVIGYASSARADIFQWEYINPADPSQGKQQSTTLAPGGAGVDAEPGVDLAGRNLTMAYLIGANLTGADGYVANLTNSDLSQANLTNASFTTGTLTNANFREANLTDAYFPAARLTDANFTGAVIHRADFTKNYVTSFNAFSSGTGITLAQLYSTASYHAHDLSGIILNANNLSSGNFAGQNLTNASFGGYYGGTTLTGADFSEANLSNVNFGGATLTNADFTGTEVRSASFDTEYCNTSYHCDRTGTGITVAQLYSTASYQIHDLSGIGLHGNNLAGGNFAGQNLTNGVFEGATVTGADFTGAEVRGANFNAYYQGTGVTLSQLYSTASYQVHDLSGIGLDNNNLAGANFAAQNLTNASFYQATLTDADFTDAEVRGANFGYFGITPAQLYSTASYQTHDLSGIGLSYNNLAAGNFAGQNLTNADFRDATLPGANFREANVANADFSGANLTGANLRDANLANASFNDRICGEDQCFGGTAVLTDADFSSAQVQGANFGSSGLTLAQLYSTASYQAHDLSGIDLTYNNLAGANFSGQKLTNAHLDANLTGADFTGAEVRGATFGSAITLAQLYSTASYQAHDLSGIALSGNRLLAGANFADQNLTNVDLSYAELTDADFTGAEIRGANFYQQHCGDCPGRIGGTGITLAQLYSTASYRAHDLSGIGLGGSDLSGGNFAGQNLTNADFGYFDYRTGPTTLTDGDLTGADARGSGLYYAADAITTNLIWPGGHIIYGLDLDTGRLLDVRDYDGNPNFREICCGDPYPVSQIPITVDQHLAMGPGGTLRMVFEADAWDSTISFAPGIPVTLGGTLELTFAADVNLASQVGRTFDLFDWTGVNPTGAFAVSSRYAWDLSNLYTTGEVTLTDVPEPAGISLAVTGCCIFLVRRRRRPHQQMFLPAITSSLPASLGEKS